MSNKIFQNSHFATWHLFLNSVVTSWVNKVQRAASRVLKYDTTEYWILNSSARFIILQFWMQWTQERPRAAVKIKGMCRPNTISVYKRFCSLSVPQFSAYMFVTIFSVCAVKRKNGPMCWSCSEVMLGLRISLIFGGIRTGGTNIILLLFWNTNMSYAQELS
jgi:hypothetical protein